MFPSHSQSKVNSVSLLAKHSYIDHLYYVLFPITCTSNFDPNGIFICSLLSKHIKK